MTDAGRRIRDEDRKASTPEAGGNALGTEGQKALRKQIAQASTEPEVMLAIQALQ